MTISATTQGLRPGVCTSTSRPSTPFDGMMIYETDTNLVRIWNGTAWKTLAYSDYTNGGVLQTVQTVKTDTFSTSSLSYVDVTGLSVTISPLSTSHKVLVVASVSVGDQAGVAWKIVGGNTASYVGDAAGSRVRAVGGQYDAVQNGPITMSGMYLDSPATTSATTYKVQLISLNSANTAYVNRSHTDSDSAIYVRGASSITAIEIAA